MGFAKYIREHEYTNSVELDAYYIQEGYILGYPLISAWCLLHTRKVHFRLPFDQCMMLITYYPEPGAYINDNTNRSACWSAFNMKRSYDMPFLRAEADLKMLHWRFDQKQIC